METALTALGGAACIGCGAMCVGMAAQALRSAVRRRLRARTPA